MVPGFGAIRRPPLPVTSLTSTLYFCFPICASVTFCKLSVLLPPLPWPSIPSSLPCLQRRHKHDTGTSPRDPRRQPGAQRCSHLLCPLAASVTFMESPDVLGPQYLLCEAGIRCRKISPKIKRADTSLNGPGTREGLREC